MLKAWQPQSVVLLCLTATGYLVERYVNGGANEQSPHLLLKAAFKLGLQGSQTLCEQALLGCQGGLLTAQQQLHKRLPLSETCRRAMQG